MKQITFLFLCILGTVIVLIVAFKAGYNVGYQDGIDDSHQMWMDKTSQFIEDLDKSSMSAPAIITMPNGTIRIVRQLYKIENEIEINDNELLTELIPKS